MTNETNPYASPSDTDQHAVDSPEVAAKLHGGLPGRISIWLIEGILAFIVVGLLFSFVFRLFAPSPYGGTILQVYQIEGFAQFFSIIAYAVLGWLLFRYIIAIRKVKTPDDFQQFSRRHGMLWNWGAVVFLALAALRIGMAAWRESLSWPN